IASLSGFNFNFKAEAAQTNTEAKKSDTSKINNDSDPWWKHAVFYEVYPRSFADGKNKGMGNLPGITSKLDYLKDLGVDAIWITPCFPSPQVDFGYDISDYCAIDPDYGTLADFDKLVAEAKKRNIKILMDLVMNHSSDKSPWFIESASSKTNPKRDWYIWKDGKNGGPPNNWQSLFGHSAWKLDPKTNQYYYHFFYPEQPDLNWRNQEVRKAMYDSVRFWLDRGVAGFRLDAVGVLFEDPNIPDNPLIPGGKPNDYGDPAMEYKYNDHLPEVHDVFKELRAVLDSYPDHPVLIGETSAKDALQLAQNYGKNHDEIQLPMNFFFAYINKLSAPEFRKQIKEAEQMSAKDWPLYFFSNHDQVRHYVRYGDGKDNDQIAKLTATLLLTLRGAPILYYGEEIGMENNDPVKVEDVKDPIGKLGWPVYKGRDGERTPMQWSAAENAGFSAAKPWLLPPPSYKKYNVAVEEKDPNSILSFYKSLIKLRRSNEALKNGDMTLIDDSNPTVLSYIRKSAGQEVLICLNMSDKDESFTLPMPDGRKAQFKTILSTIKDCPASISSDKVKMSPHSVFIGELK
ncbi:MAG: alpha-glucosidase, partial [Candidatus Obscuribacterales bacterium]|nr:alpha-glucosidase [Candidatus Obscuribacterales bacterium]